VFSAVISEHPQKQHDYICIGCKNIASQKCAVFNGHPVDSVDITEISWPMLLSQEEKACSTAD